MEEIEQELKYLLGEYKETGDDSRIANVLESVEKQINLAVSKERESIVEGIKLETDAWLRTELLWLQSTLHKKVFITDEIKMEYVDSAIEDILKLINTK